MKKIWDRLLWKGQDWKTRLNKSKNPADITNYKKQRYLVVSLNHQAKSEYFIEVSNSESSWPFLDICKSYFSSKHARGESKIMLIENNQII